MPEETNIQTTMRERLGDRNHDEFIEALVKAQNSIGAALSETDTVKARRQIEDAAANLKIAEWRVKSALTGLSR